MSLIIFLIYYAGLIGVYGYLVEKMDDESKDWANWLVSVLWPVVTVVMVLASVCGTVWAIFCGWWCLLRIARRGY